MAALAALAVAGFLLLEGPGGSDDSQTATPAGGGSQTAAPGGGGLRPVATDSGLGDDIRVGYETHVDAIQNRKEDVFCGGVTDRFVAETLGKPGAACLDEARRLIAEVKEPPRGDTVRTARVAGNRAQVETKAGLGYDLVCENDIWTVDREK